MAHEIILANHLKIETINSNIKLSLNNEQYVVMSSSDINDKLFIIDFD